MRALLQRVSGASVSVGGQELARTGPGFLIFIGIASQDVLQDAQYLVDKTVNLRVFPDEEGRFNRSALDTKAELLVVSQFTLYADTRRGRRPDFTEAMAPEAAEALYQQTVELYRATGLTVVTGRFREHMLVTLTNDGPVTILVDSVDRLRPRNG